MSTRKYHVTIEDCVDQDDLQDSNGFTEIDLNNVNNNQTSSSEEKIGSKRQAWENTDALEEQARSEKIQDESIAKANAIETARIVQEAQQQQSSGV